MASSHCFPTGHTIHGTEGYQQPKDSYQTTTIYVSQLNDGVRPWYSQTEDLRGMIRITLASASAKANETAQGIIGRNVDALWALQYPTACHGEFYRLAYGHLPNAILFMQFFMGPAIFSVLFKHRDY